MEYGKESKVDRNHYERMETSTLLMNVKIIIAAHKPYWMPQDDMYLPLHVGSAGKPSIGFARDDSGDHISEKNPKFCELTGLYWAWKNLSADYIGLAHYRRHFSMRSGETPEERVLSREQLEPVLLKTDVILPKKRHYYIETIYSHYAHTFDASHLDITREIISEKYPTYLINFDLQMKARSAHMFNMLIMKKEYLDQYCAWLFDILFELEKRIPTEHMSDFDARLFGRVSEVLLDVWLLHNQTPYREIGYVYMERIQWRKKIIGFLKAKFFHVKYQKSW